MEPLGDKVLACPDDLTELLKPLLDRVLRIVLVWSGRTGRIGAIVVPRE